ncbi:sugar MFS transporter [Algibacillus agarilyticus]|uniref:sugar MFS transporter n=1 Tax=Algibacillus agarilyticus TaxID=2234133 RepID=UPI000DD01194|nr:sugar MFS transporter [Algibacillus agarilyticus]
MAASITATHSQQTNRNALFVLSLLFFMWGFITALNDILIPYLKGMFALSYLQAMAVNFCFFGAYAVVSYPAGNFVKYVGYRKGIVFGLAIAALGCLIFYPAAEMREYSLFLLGLFVLASGITLLQVAANPFVTAIGTAETASSRLNLTQAFNSLGTTIAPIFGSVLILSVMITASPNDAELTAAELSARHAQEASSVQFPYLLLTLVLVLLSVVFAKWVKLPEIKQATEAEVTSSQPAWHYKHLTLGAIGIFVYVGGEVSIGSFLVNFLGESNIASMPEHEAAKYVSIFWGGAMIGRFIGSALMLKMRANLLLAINATMVVLLLAVVMLADGAIAMWAVLAIGFFNSIMFPTIFSLAIAHLGAATSNGSGILCVAIVGGALVPLIQGALADTIGIQLAFIVPLVCYLYIIFYGLKGYKPQL